LTLVKWFVTHPTHEIPMIRNCSEESAPISTKWHTMEVRTISLFRHGAWFRMLRNSEYIGTVKNAV
jgi:hypothetical protein